MNQEIQTIVSMPNGTRNVINLNTCNRSGYLFLEFKYPTHSVVEEYNGRSKTDLHLLVRRLAEIAQHFSEELAEALGERESG